MGKIFITKLVITGNYEYDFIISASTNIEVVLYDSTFNVIDITLHNNTTQFGKEFSKNLLWGTYYLKINYVDTNNNGEITVNILSPHTHQ